jgi:hypothetical protein
MAAAAFQSAGVGLHEPQRYAHPRLAAACEGTVDAEGMTTHSSKEGQERQSAWGESGLRRWRARGPFVAVLRGRRECVAEVDGVVKAPGEAAEALPLPQAVGEHVPAASCRGAL